MSVPQRVLKTPDQVQEDLLYLQENKVCETLEFIVKGLLREQPEDPILSICNMLRASNRSNSSVRFSAGSTKGPALSLADQTATHNARETESDVCTPVANDASEKTFPAACGATEGASASVYRATAGGGSSRLGTPASSVPNGKWTDAQSNATRLERDESSRSDGSAFSISSVDMSEFLSEFRAAHLGLFGENGGTLITLQDLADIVDKIAIPLPDVKLLVDLFAELKETAPIGDAVSFDAFLARMNYKIQGRYPLEVVKNVYFTLLPSDTLSCSNRGIPASASVGSNLDAFLMGTISSEAEVKDSLADTQGLHLMQGTPAANVTVEKVSAALWQGLGLQHDAVALENLLAPFRKGTSVTLFLTDFAKIVHALSNQRDIQR